MKCFDAALGPPSCLPRAPWDSNRQCSAASSAAPPRALCVQIRWSRTCARAFGLAIPGTSCPEQKVLTRMVSRLWRVTYARVLLRPLASALRISKENFWFYPEHHRRASMHTGKTPVHDQCFVCDEWSDTRRTPIISCWILTGYRGVGDYARKGEISARRAASRPT